MESGPIIFNISSDDDSGWDEAKEGDCSGADDDLDWLTKVINDFDQQNEDSDEVVVVGEANSRKKSPKPSKLMAKDDEDDDDCVVLEGDPDNPVAVVDQEADSDELVIVGEKGQIACRDYPHARHLCAKYPFISSSHEKHCDLCHCYVCDSLAPCMHWGTGLSDTDHCHATDEVERWKHQRQNLKWMRSVPNLVSKSPASSLPATLPQFNQTARFDHVSQQNQVLHNNHVDRVPQMNQFPPIIPVHLDQNSSSRVQFSKQSAIHRSSLPANTGVPNITRENGRQPREYFVARNRFQQHSGVRKWHENNSLRRHRAHNTGNSSPQFISSGTAFKTVGTHGSALRRNQFMHRPVHDINSVPLPQYRGTHHVTNVSNMSNSHANAGPSQHRLYAEPISQLNDSTHNFQHGNQTQNTVDHGSQIFNHQGNQNNISSVSHRIDLGWVGNSSQSNQQSATEDFHLQSGMVTNQQSPVEIFDLHNPSSQGSLGDSPQLHSQSIQQAPADSLQIYHWSDPQPTAASLYCHSQSNFHSPTEDFHLGSTEPFREPSPADFNSQPVSTSNSSGFYLESLMFENSSDPVTLDHPDPSQMSILSPDRATLDPPDLPYFNV